MRTKSGKHYCSTLPLIEIIRQENALYIETPVFSEYKSQFLKI
ncbi:MAG: hypothetical protein ACMUEM_03100 [Flavobacteriales bacterium AspAUS03]